MSLLPLLGIARSSGLSRSHLYDLVDGSATPHPETYALLLETVDMLERNEQNSRD